MLRKFAVVVLCTLAGLVAGVEVSWYGTHYHPSWFGLLGGYRYYFSEQIVLPPGSDARHLIAAMKDQHADVQVVARRPRIVTISAAGSIHANLGVAKAGREVLALNHGQGKRRLDYGLAFSLAGDPPIYGLLAGLGIGLGFVMPLRRRRPA